MATRGSVGGSVGWRGGRGAVVAGAALAVAAGCAPGPSIAAGAPGAAGPDAGIADPVASVSPAEWACTGGVRLGPGQRSLAMTWVEVDPPADAAGLEITAACAVAEDNVLFAANDDATSTSAEAAPPRILRWARGVWTTELVMDAAEWSPGPGWPRAYVSGVAVDGSWAALGHRILRRTSGDWAVIDGWQTLPDVQALTTSYPVGPIRAGAAGDLWAMVGPRLLVHWSHGSWQSFPVLPPDGYDFDFFSEPWVASGGDVWLGAGKLSATGGAIVNSAVLLHFDGWRWSSVDAGFFQVYFAWGDGGAGVWFGTGGPETLPLRHYNPSTGAITAYPQIGDWAFPGGMTAIWGTSPDDLWVAGNQLASWRDGSWTLDTSLPPEMRAEMRALSGNVVMTGDRKSLWLVGDGPTFFHGRGTSPAGQP